MKEMVGGCCVCSDERGWPDNPLVYCDGNGCTVAVHQACYGIVTVPVGPWYCRKCESPDVKGKVKCELCPSKSGALKRSDNGGWAHVVCALYIPEVRFGNVTSMEPIVLRLIPQERYNKVCYICQEQGKSHRANAGACMQCNKSGCRQQFHVTCAQSLGLLCEEAGNYLDNVKYCGYCQHHYSKLKKGGNVKTIPPYKPVSHDSQSSDSSGEKEGGASPMAAGAGGGTPTHSKSKGTGRKSSHSSSTSGKNTPNSSSKTPTTSSQSTDLRQETAMETPPPSTRKHKSADKHKKKPSPSRRGSAAEGGGSKSSTPAPSPQHATDGKAPGGSTPTASKVVPPASSPSASKTSESVGVISSVASTAATTATIVATPPSTSMTTSVVQSPASKPEGQSVITNTEAMEVKQTKKRKAVSGGSHGEYSATPATGAGDPNANWEVAHPNNDVQMEPADKTVKKAKTESGESGSVTSQPPPARSPASQPSPRHLPSPMPGPSGVNPPTNIRSPSQHQGKGEREPMSLLVSVPLASTTHGLNLSANAQVSAPPLPPPEMPGPAPHIFHQPMKQAAMEPSMPAHSPHAVGSRGWSGLNVAYEMQQDQAKPGGSGMVMPKEPSAPTNPTVPPVTIRNKKRAAMAAAVVGVPPPNMQTSATQSLVNVRKPPQPTPPPIYQETIKDSPPSSPNSERPLKPKTESRMFSAPHMLGNELNPSSVAAARLQEQLTAELAAHAAGAGADQAPVPPPLINKAAPGSASRSGGTGAQSLDQLLERQWEQGSQFLMEQAQHFDIASLLSCLHQLRTENVRLEEHVGNLLQRRDHLLAVNARLAIPLTASEMVTGGSEPQRCPRENGAPAVRPPQPQQPERPHQLIMREVQQKPS